MAEKLSWTELRRAVAKRAGVSEKTASVFLNAVQAQLVEALKSDKQVKINGLGTFKVQAVAPRKSVNVTTGEEITIEGYNKLTFTPEAGVKELVESSKVESGESKVESSPEIDPIQKLGAQAEEIVDILGDLGQSPVEAVSEEPASEPIVAPEPVVKPVFVPEPAFVPEPEPIAEPETEPQPKKKKKYHFLRDTLICVVILLLLLFVGYFFLRQQLSDIIGSFLKPSETELVVDTDTTAVAVDIASGEEDTPEGAISQEQILAEFLEASGELLEGTGKYPNLITTEPMHEASRLTWMAKRYYGAKVYWPYLYDANRDIIDNPNKIEVGTPIRVPKLTKAQLDTTSTAFEQLRREAEEACKK